MFLQNHHAQKYLHKIVKLLTDKHSCHLYDRHIDAMMKIANYYSEGYVSHRLVTSHNHVTMSRTYES